MSRMPVVFVGHGSPMNAIESNPFTEQWQKIVAEIPRPEAILSISAHWFTRGTRVSDAEQPRMVYDMYGFPAELYRVRYDAPGSPTLAAQVQKALGNRVQADATWGLDHGTWSVLRWMFPAADIPVVQLSVDANASMRDYFEMGKRLAPLREQGILIFGSGNVVHHLARVAWDMRGGFPWADEFDAYIKTNILARHAENVIDYHRAGASASLAFPTPDHFAPLLYALGASNAGDTVRVFNDQRVLGSLSMTGYLFETQTAATGEQEEI